MGDCPISTLKINTLVYGISYCSNNDGNPPWDWIASQVGTVSLFQVEYVTHDLIWMGDTCLLNITLTLILPILHVCKSHTGAKDPIRNAYESANHVSIEVVALCLDLIAVI